MFSLISQISCQRFGNVQKLTQPTQHAMKVKVLNRNQNDYIRQRTGDLPKLSRNLDPALHPYAAQREYQQALNAVKLERVFAKPFVGSLDGKLLRKMLQRASLYICQFEGSQP